MAWLLVVVMLSFGSMFAWKAIDVPKPCCRQTQDDIKQLQKHDKYDGKAAFLIIGGLIMILPSAILTGIYNDSFK
jgi:hypothetical protein